MTRLVSIAFVVTLLVPTWVHAAAAQSVYRWQDAHGGVHFSNQVESAPSNAVRVDLAPLGRINGPPTAARRVSARGAVGLVARVARRAASCGPADSRKLSAAVLARLESKDEVGPMTLLVAGVPVSHSSDAVVRVTLPDPDARYANLEQAAVAYPAGASCPESPPLVRYPVAASGRHGTSSGLCDDYRRAFAQVGAAAGRDQGVARSFRDIATDFVRVADTGYVARDAGLGFLIQDGFISTALEVAPRRTVSISPWIVEAHIAQTGDLGGESSALVDELTVALEEIDRAARASGCW